MTSTNKNKGNAHHFMGKDFSLTERRALTRKGITIIGSKALPGPGEMPWANAERGYLIDDNGTGRVLSYAEVRAMAR